MEQLRIKDDLYWVGVRDPHLKVFDIIMETEFGTTYNSYLIKGEKNILVEAAKNGFAEEYLDKIEKVVAKEKIDYIIINHTEPDHTGLMAKLFEKYPEMQVICTKPAYMYLKAMLNRDFNCVTVTDGQEMDLGDKRFKFISAPFLHWPDTMFTYYMDKNIMFTCDFLGCHFCVPEGKIYNDEAGDFSKAFSYYFDVIMGPFKQHVLNAIEKLKTVDIEMFCTSHGPILRKNIWEYVELYKKWSQEGLKPKERKNILVAYVSAYGYTKAIGEKLYETIKNYKQDIDVEIIDITQHDLNTVREKIEGAEGLLIGSPTINQDALKPVWDALSVICPIVVKGKPAAAFGSYGWSGEAVKMLEERLKSLKYKVSESGLRITFAPSEQDLSAVEEFAKKFADTI